MTSDTFDRSELKRLINEIDIDLAKEGFTVPQRPLHAIGRISDSLGVSLPMSRPGKHHRHAADANWPISEFIHKWYEELYQDKTKTQAGIGQIAISIRHDVYLAKLPIVFGAIEVIVDRKKKAVKPGFGRGPGEMNVLDCIDGITPAIRDRLSDNDLGELHKIICTALTVAIELGHSGSKASKKPMIQSDINAAATHLTDTHREYGLSKWASLQASEKALKYAIVCMGDAPRNTHNLSSLMKECTKLGLELPNAVIEQISEIQCTAGVRYGEELVSEVEAIVAHHSSIVLIHAILEQVNGNCVG